MPVQFGEETWASPTSAAVGTSGDPAVRRALNVIPAEKLMINPDCGLVHLPREVAFNKLSAMAEGARLVREGLK